MNDDAILRMLAKLVAPYVTKELGSIEASVYSTESRASYPPGRYDDDDRKARRQARDRIARAGGVQTGKGRASVWTIDRAAYAAASTRKPKVATTTVAANGNDEEAAAEADLRASGLRTTLGTNGRLPPMISGCRMSDPEPEGSAA